MSGELVGEVIAAVDRLKSAGLSERGFHALVAIAEKCHPKTRQGSVRWDHIRAGLYGASLSTAKRAVRDLRTAELVSVIKRGFDNHAGRACAPIYEMSPLTERVTQVTQSTCSERVTQVTQSPVRERVKPEGRTGQTGDRTGHSGDLLDGSIDGSLDGGAATGAPPPRPGPEPNRYCDSHNGPTTDRCRDCGSRRNKHEQWLARKRSHDTFTATQRRAAIAACPVCDENGHLDGGLDSNGNEQIQVCGHGRAR